MANPSRTTFLMRGLFPTMFGIGAYYTMADWGNESAREALKKTGHFEDTKAKSEKEEMINTLFGKRSSNLSDLRKETTEKRRKVAEEYYEQSVAKERSKESVGNESKS